MAANFTEIQVCNKALLRIGANMITATNDTVDTITSESLEAKLCKLNFDLIRDIVCEDRVWSFALRRAELDFIDPEPPAYGFANRFAVPLDALNIWRVSNSHGQVDWILEDDFILTDEDVIRVHYIKRLNSQELLNATPQFIDSLSLRLAVELCMPLTENATMLESLKTEYEYRLVNASSIDGGTATHEQIKPSKLIGSRQGYQNV